MERSKEAGFTLIEALISMVILIVGIAGIANLFFVAANTNAVANRMTGTALAASEQLERLKAAPFDDAALTVGGPACLYDGTAACPTDCTTYCRADNIPGVGAIRTRWVIQQVIGDVQTLYIVVRSEAPGRAGIQGRTELTTFRVCTSVNHGCPPHT